MVTPPRPDSLLTNSISWYCVTWLRQQLSEKGICLCEKREMCFHFYFINSTTNLFSNKGFNWYTLFVPITMLDLNHIIMHNLTFTHKHPTHHLAEGAKPNQLIVFATYSHLRKSKPSTLVRVYTKLHRGLTHHQSTHLKLIQLDTYVKIIARSNNSLSQMLDHELFRSFKQPIFFHSNAYLFVLWQWASSRSNTSD